MAQRGARWIVAARSVIPSGVLEMSARRSPGTGGCRPLRHISYFRAVDGVPAPGAFSRATVHNGLVYVSGTGADNDTAGGAVPEMTAAEETLRALENVATILRATGSSPDQIVSASMLLSNRDDYAECNAAYVDFFSKHGGPELPARSTALWGVPTTAKVAFSVVAVQPDPSAAQYTE
ncbi:unnamed protein product [Prorocentrum cordatum]|uniref:RidA family protein n=1 Tax=Prorocentrum cordatum TaxID=2364126 RepID=A0ABN9UKX6_9DINO|nr:unnamed protein product [Polarella glacialis]|mmetsp:Transcript_11195/g.29556  ORF Transcript_11195/g.29556 Transcript_11195/m.29556 type:complete len:178 (+) Transcript_11195:3-536(+)